MKRGALIVFAGIMLIGLFSMALLSTEASAADVGGQWTGRFVETYAAPGGSTMTIRGDVSLDITVSGSDLGGSMTLSTDSGISRSYDILDGSVSGDIFTIHVQFGWDGVSYCDCDIEFHMDGNEATGAGSYSNVGTPINFNFTITKGGGAAAVATAALGIGAGAVGIVTAVTPAPRPGPGPSPQPATQQAPPQPYAHQRAYVQPRGSYGHAPPQGETGETPYGTGYPEPGTPQGGAGMTWGAPDPTVWNEPGAPPSPQQWFSNVSQNPVQCPFHPGTFCTPHYQHVNDPGHWHCPRCNRDPWQGMVP